VCAGSFSLCRPTDNQHSQLQQSTCVCVYLLYFRSSCNNTLAYSGNTGRTAAVIGPSNPQVKWAVPSQRRHTHCGVIVLSALAPGLRNHSPLQRYSPLQSKGEYAEANLLKSADIIMNVIIVHILSSSSSSSPPLLSSLGHQPLFPWCAWARPLGTIYGQSRNVLSFIARHPNKHVGVGPECVEIKQRLQHKI